MHVYGLLPLRRLDDAKGRLGPQLAPDERAQLALGLLERAATALLAGGVARVLVVTRDARLSAADVSSDPRVSLQQQDAALPGLNGAVRQGQRWALDAGADALLVTLPDLPLLDAVDIRALLAASDDGALSVLAPDRAGTGSNALLLAPPNVIETAFGVNSAARHQAAYTAAQQPLLRVQRPGLSLALDTADDMAALARRGHDWRAYLRELEPVTRG
jgi:2-phospho-L-lactate guanylyltransferase